MLSKIEQPIPTKIKFTDFYEPNINWMDEPEINVLEMLKSYYLSYFQDNTCNYERIKTDILESKKAKPTNKAHELFKALFKMPYKTIGSVVTPDLIQIEEEFGEEIFAHGVEEQKGGMYNLLLMCISNQVRVPSEYWGTFVRGLPNISPVGHGPYYLIYTMPSVNQLVPQPHNPQLSDVARILVPFSENSTILIDKLEAMVAVNLITQEAKRMFIEKLVTYKEFLNELRILGNNKALSDVSNQNELRIPSQINKASSDVSKQRFFEPAVAENSIINAPDALTFKTHYQ